MDRRETDIEDEAKIMKYIEEKTSIIKNLKRKHEIVNSDFEKSFLTHDQIQMLFDCYANKKLDEDLTLMYLYGGENELIKYARMNIKTGLSEFYEGREMIVRQDQYGNNRQEVDDSDKTLSILWESFCDPYMITLVIFSLFSIGLYLAPVSIDNNINVIEGASIILASILVSSFNALLSYYKERQYAELEEKLKECKKNSLLRDKKFVERHPEEIKVGDIVQLMPGTTIPADGIVIKGKELSVDESFCKINVQSDSEADIDNKILHSASKSLFHESLHISKIFKSEGKINDKAAIETIISEYKSSIRKDTAVNGPVTQEVIQKLHDVAEKYRVEGEGKAEDTVLDSPIVLSGTNVVQGIGQMLVLAVGSKRYYVRKNIDDTLRDEEESALQIKLEDFSSQIKTMAMVAAVLITLVKWGRITCELLLLSGFMWTTTTQWKNSIKELYYTSDMSSMDFWKIGNYYLNGVLLLLTVLVVSVPEGLEIAANMSMALSIHKLVENGILVKNVRALESIGSLDRLVFDYTRGFTLNEINFQQCIINDSSHQISNNNEIVPNLKLNEMTDTYKFMLVECLYMDYYKELNITTDGANKYFQSSQISEYDIATILLLKALKFEHKQDEQLEEEQRGQDAEENGGVEAEDTGAMYAEMDMPEDNKLDEPCKTIWKIAFSRDIKLAIFLVNYRENGADKFRLWIKGHPYSVLKYCSHYFEDNEKYLIKYNKESTFDSRKHIENYYKNSYKVMSYAYKDIPEEKFVQDIKGKLNENLIRDLVIKDQDLTLFFTYALSDRLDSKAERICSQLMKHNIKICVITKGDKKLANIITKKYLKCDDENKKKDENTSNEKFTKDELRDREIQEEDRVMMLPVAEKVRLERFLVSGPEVLKDWKATALSVDNLDATQIKLVVDYFKNIHCIYNCSEEVKYIYVRLMKAIGDSSCVTGNFHEETQVLKESDVSIKMGIDSSYSAIDAANIVLQKGRLDVLMNTMIYGRNMIVNVKKFIEYQLTINFSIVAIIAITIATNKDSPFTFLQLLWINLLMDTFAAIALAYQNPRENINKLKFTIDKKDSLINPMMWVNIIFQSTLITAISLYIYYYGTSFLKLSLEVTSTSIDRNKDMISGRNYHMDGRPDYLEYLMQVKTDEFVPAPYYGSIHMTIMFNTFIMFHLFNLVNIRVRDEETIGNIIQQNLLFWSEFFCFLLIQVLFIYFLKYGGFMSIDMTHWLYCLCFGFTSSILSIIIILIELLINSYVVKADD